MTVEGSNNGMLTYQRMHGERDTEVGSSQNYGHDRNIDIWAGSLERILEDVPQYMCRPGHAGRISRIPETLHELDVKAYEPSLLSIGPYHHGKPMLQSMENTKRLVLKCLLQVKPEHTLKDYLTELKSIESAARSFYSDVEMDSENFVHMLLVDSIYILTSFCGMATSQENTNQIIEAATNEDNGDNMDTMVDEDDSNDDMSGENNTARLFASSIHHDIFLLENQLPFFVLQKIYVLVYHDSQTQLISIMKDRVADLLFDYVKPDSEMVILPTIEIHHLLHLCHMLFTPTIQQETDYQVSVSDQMFRLESAVQLYESGVSFVARSDSHYHSLLDISFTSSGKMFMPSLCVDSNTNSLFRNLIALEQMKYPSMGLNVSAYAVLLLHLVTTPEDVKLLRRKEVIQHHLPSDKEMMYFVNQLSVGLSFDYIEDTYSLKPVFQELKRYSEHRIPRWKAWLKHRYFNNPWTVISLLAASILLILSVVQTFYAVYSYYHPYFDGRHS